MQRDALVGAASAWLAYVRDDRGLSGATVATYRSQLRRCFVELGDSFTADDLGRAIAGRIDERCSPHTRTQAFVVLNQFFDWWAYAGGPLNPLRARQRPPRSKARRRGMTEEEIDIAGRCLQGASHKDRAIAYLMLFQGFRIGDVTKLKVPDLDFSGKRIRAHQGKGGTDTWLPMADEVAEVIQVYLEDTGIDGGFVFTGTNGRLTPQSVGRAWRRVRGGELVGVVPHMLRHTYANEILKGTTADVWTLRQLMRHSSLATTQLYLDENKGREQAAIIDLNARLRERMQTHAPLEVAP